MTPERRRPAAPDEDELVMPCEHVVFARADSRIDWATIAIVGRRMMLV